MKEEVEAVSDGDWSETDDTTQDPDFKPVRRVRKKPRLEKASTKVPVPVVPPVPLAVREPVASPGEMDSLRRSLEERNDTIRDLRIKCERQESQIEDLKARPSVAVINELEALRQELQATKKALDAKDEANAKLAKEVIPLRYQLEAANLALAQKPQPPVAPTVTELDKTVTRLKEDVATLRKKMDTKGAFIELLQKECKERREKYEATQNALSRCVQGMCRTCRQKHEATVGR